jgi:UDP-N-acetyl-D-glucosamine/UDP-N-acetyl-D-galactosamine dehydrogenase
MVLNIMSNKKKISVIGCGYVGLPLINSLGNFYQVIGYDIDETRILELKRNKNSNAVSTSLFKKKMNVNFTSKFDDIKSSNIYIITLPTPLNSKNLPYLDDIRKLSKKISKILKKGDLVIYESTVFPGATEEIFIPDLKKHNKLKLNKDFWVGYSPERINPGDKKNTLENIKKVTSASNLEGLKKVNNIYSKIIKAGIHPVNKIKIAELSKVLENTQRFVNIALINEIAVLCDNLSISSKEVLKAASTKWNFINFKPGLVGGHCIAVDPMYLLFKSNKFKFPNDIIYSSQKINKFMSKFIIDKTISEKYKNYPTLILGLAFKPNCRDTRNSGVFDLIRNLNKKGIEPDVYDPLIFDKPKNKLRYNFLKKLIKKNYKNILIAVAHKQIKKLGIKRIKNLSNDKNKVKIFDISSHFDKKNLFFQL